MSGFESSSLYKKLVSSDTPELIKIYDSWAPAYEQVRVCVVCVRVCVCVSHHQLCVWFFRHAYTLRGGARIVRVQLKL